MFSVVEYGKHIDMLKLHLKVNFIFFTSIYFKIYLQYSIICLILTQKSLHLKILVNNVDDEDEVEDYKYIG